jgi:heptosyltransferase I
MKVAIVKLSALGDIIHAMVVMQFIKKCNHSIIVDWIVEDCYKDLLESNPDINNVYTVNFKKAKKNQSLYLFLKELRKVSRIGSYDLVIDMQGLVKSALIARMVSSRITLGFDKNSIKESLASFFYNQKFNYPYDKNVIERNLAIVSNALEFSVSKDEIYKKKFFLHSSKSYIFSKLSYHKYNILIIPGASYQSKSYPVVKLAELTMKLDANFLVLWGTELEQIMAREIKDLSSHVHILEKLSLDELISLIGQLDLVIGPDTGPTHIAWALNIPSITLFGPTPSYRNIYTTPINKSIESSSKVDPLKINKNDYSIKNIKLEDIVKMATYLLKLKSLK